MPARGLPISAIRHGRIAAIGDIAEGLAGEIIDATGLHILPGVIDSQVHFREPGLEHKEDLASGSRSAVLGGVTAVFEMPNTKPLDHERRRRSPTRSIRARGRMHCDFAFFVGATRDNVDALPELELLPGAAGIKVFMGSSTGDLLVDDEETLCAHSRQDQPARGLPRRGRGAAQGAPAPCSGKATRRATANGATPRRR